MVRRIFLTHCSAEKDNSLKGSNKKVTPDKLYTATFIQRFVSKCKEKGVEWAILSDKYGIVFSNEEIEWHDRHPSKVTKKEFELLLKSFEEKLINYDEIYFYYNPGRSHPLYKQLLSKNKLKDGIRLFTHIEEIM